MFDRDEIRRLSRWLRRSEAAAYLGVTVWTLHDWVGAGLIKPYYPTAGCPLFDRKALDDFVLNSTQNPTHRRGRKPQKAAA